MSGSILRFLFFIIVALWSVPALAIERPKPAPEFKEYKGLKSLFLSPVLRAQQMPSTRPSETDETNILKHPNINHITTRKNTMTLCQDVAPYSHKSWAHRAGRVARIAAAHGADHIEEIRIQPRFSGLKGPVLSIMRKDLENALVHNIGSSAEIFHNAKQTAPDHTACANRFSWETDTEYRAHIDLIDSDKSPLYRIDGITRARAHMGQNFMGSLGIKVPISHNLNKDEDLLTVDDTQSVGQYDIAYASQPMSLGHLSMHGFFTLKPDLYLAGHAGYLEEKFIGIGGEILYRPHTKPWAIGFDLWRTAKRDAVKEGQLSFHNNNTQTSAFINGWYEMPRTPVTLGLSIGRFLDGDFGGEIKTIYKPKSGWSAEMFARYSNEFDTSLDNNQTTNATIGLRLSAPLESLHLHPENSRATIEVAPFRKDKRQRIHNEYPLYDLTDPWSTHNLHRYWDEFTQ